MTCADLQKAEKASGKFFKATSYSSKVGHELTQRVAQLRATLVRFGVDGAATMTAEELDDAADGAVFKTIRMGQESYQSVNIALGDNPFILLFKPDTLTPAGIESQDGTLSIGGAYCELKSEL